MDDVRNLAEEIRHCYRFVKRPMDSEVRSILTEINRIKLSGKRVDESTIHDVIYRNVQDTRSFVIDSVDMSGTVSVLKQILDAAAQQK
ncbi:hypothetical protein [Massilia aquatica]|uniref:Uncharacterized protein n=1 Tax=Massilia aquatica TaxID=2609000 RepID=A0ABX0LUQ0_9BURK|nr:hypothetical protein [Massilia aquatica]NHZ38578.1 hypothetical protein [Massilia aquatica]